MNLIKKTIVITGGAGFIGINLADRLLSEGYEVIIYDNLARPGSEKNLQWLTQKYHANLQVVIADIRDTFSLKKVINDCGAIFHFAAQVAVTTSLVNPVDDFEINLKGTFNLLEILRTMTDPPFLLFTSTNKVYGKLTDIELIENAMRYTPLQNWQSCVNEHRTLDFYSPYGCSKGGAEQYVLDFARSFSIPATVFRMSCIYGPHQFGNEDQGWVAHFLISAINNNPLVIYGNGKQVRDILYIDDLLNAFVLAYQNQNRCAGNVFTIGGGGGCTLSLLELIEFIKTFNGSIPQISFAPWRTGDQPYYVSDTQKFHDYTGWNQTVHVPDGINMLYKWINGSIQNSCAVEMGFHS
jgi:CDP-paratose 2-epimerase